MNSLLQSVEQAQLKTNIPEFNSGDTVRVHVRVVEGNRERIQVFEGVVIRYRGAGINRNFTVRRIASGVGVERTFLLNSPRIEKIEVVRYGKVRRANLYYLRGRTGKAARIKERRYVPAAKGPATTPAVAAVEAPAPVAVAEPTPAGEADTTAIVDETTGKSRPQS